MLLCVLLLSVVLAQFFCAVCGVVMQINMLEVLACPSCQGRLSFDAASNTLRCKVERIQYPIEDDIPVLLVARATPISEDD
jgi:uncharacterized protein